MFFEWDITHCICNLQKTYERNLEHNILIHKLQDFHHVMSPYKDHYENNSPANRGYKHLCETILDFCSLVFVVTILNLDF